MSGQTVDALRQGDHRQREIAQEPRSPYLTAAEAIAYLRLHSQSALYRLVREHGLPNLRRGRLYLFDTREIDAWLRGFDSSVDQRRHGRQLRAVPPSPSMTTKVSSVSHGDR